MSVSILDPPNSRRVKLLEVRAASESDARQASIALADALRTASMPFADQGRLVVIRRLPLGQIPARASPATLALHIERILREIARDAVPFDSPAAPAANAVIFSAHIEGIVRLAARHARRLGATEWFWTSIAPAWRSELSRGERWIALLEAAHALPEAAIAASAVVGEAVCTQVEDELLCAVPPGQGAEWLQMAGWKGSRNSFAEAPANFLSGRYERVVRHWQRRWGTTDDRLIWLMTMAAVLERPARAADPQLHVRAAAWLEASRERGQMDATGPIEARIPREDPSLEITHSQTSTESSHPPGEVEATPVPQSPIADGRHGENISSKDDPARQTEIRSLEGEFTPCAGLLFLVPVLQRLQFAEFVAAHPLFLEDGFPARLLQFVGRRVGLKPDDPMTLALDASPSSEFVASSWELPREARELLAASLVRAPTDTPQAAWLVALRRWCRRRARIGLTTLIRRPGRLLASHTHLDVCFDLAEADVRLRRIALDVDPGWVPWLGRVVRFHYLESHEIHG
jgi:hypothetical protein